MKIRAKSIVMAGAMVLAGILAQAVPPMIGEAGAQPTAVPNQSYGASYGEWGARWWQWLFSFPAASNPNLEQGVVDCARGQAGNVWFLAGAFGGTVSRSCTIPAGKAIFFPLVNSLAYKAKGFETLIEQRALAAGMIDDVTSLTCTWHGSPCPGNLRMARAATPSFTVISPAKGLLPPGQLTVPGNTDPLVADGYWMLLTGLPPGEYVLVFGGATSGFAVQVTYILNIL